MTGEERNTQRYVFVDDAWPQERERLASLEAQFDPSTTHTLESLGVRPGWRCLDVGAGSGSIAAWLCTQVGPHGHVVATDLDTTLLATLAAPNLEVRRHDITRDPLEAGSYDLIHARAVLAHLPERVRVLTRLVAALKSGGWLVVEAPDWSSCAPVFAHDSACFTAVLGQFMSILTARGADLTYGLRLEEALSDAGLEEIVVESHLSKWGGEAPLTPFFVLSFARLRTRLLEAKELSAEAVEQFFTLITEPGFRAYSFTAYTGRGRRPRL